MNLGFSQHPTIIPFLKANEVHIWSAYLPSSERDISYFESILSGDERQNVNSLKFHKDQKNYITARGILRCLLGKYLRQAPQEIELLYGCWGKPCLRKQPIHFNLTHSKEYALYALTCQYEVGIDLEYIDESLELEDIALNILNAQEFLYWKQLNSEEKVKTFFDLWVRKEAFFKASGKGWLNEQQTVPLEGFDSLIVCNKNMLTHDNMKFSYSFEAISGFASAIFIQGPFLQPIHFKWELRK